MPHDTARRRVPLAAWIVAAMVLGGIAGEILGESAAGLSRVGSTILDLIKGLAGPFLFFAVLDAFLRTRIEAQAGGKMVAISLTNATIAVAIGLTLSNVLQPGRSLHLPSAPEAERATRQFGSMARAVDPNRRIDFLGDFLGLVPTSIVRPFLDNAILSIVILAVLLGAALRRAKSEQEGRGEGAFRAVEEGVATIHRALEVVLGWIISLVPLAVFAVVARAVGEWGLGPLKGLAVYLGVGLLGLAIQVGLVYQAWLTLVARVPLRRFWAGAREAVVYAAGTGSSLASLPVTLRALDRMGVSPASARLAACVGTNLNNDGILLYEAMAVLFVAQASGVHLSLGAQLLAAASCVAAGIGISGIPEAGLISLLIVLQTVRVVPDERVNQVVPLLLTVDWILGRGRAMTNVTSDMLVAVLLDRSGSTPPAPAAPPPAPLGDEPTFVDRDLRNRG